MEGSGDIEETASNSLPKDASQVGNEQDKTKGDTVNEVHVIEPTCPEDSNSTVKDTEDNTKECTEENTEENTEKNTEESTMENTDENTEENTDENTEGNTDENTAENTDENTEENTKENKEHKTEPIQEKINSITDKYLEEEEAMLHIDDQTLGSLSEGFLNKIQPELDCFSSSFQELTRNQRVLMETVQQENAKLSENKDVKDLADMVADAKIYYQKLVNIKKDMMQLHEKTTKIKKRALKLQGQKMKDNLIREQRKDQELEQERKLIAQPARRSNML